MNSRQLSFVSVIHDYRDVPFTIYVWRKFVCKLGLCILSFPLFHYLHLLVVLTSLIEDNTKGFSTLLLGISRI